MASLYDLMINELRRRQLAFVNVFPGYYISSVGCHMFNLMNQDKHVWTAGGEVVNTRMHIIKVAPPGCGKSTWINSLLRNYSGLIHGSDIPVVKKGSMTAAALAGQIKNGPEGLPILTDGVAKKESSSIVGIEEFSAITAGMQQLHNTDMDTHLLQLLDDGHVVLDRGPGSIDYYSQMTLHAGVQPAKYDLGSGMGRRMWFILFTPSIPNMEVIRGAIRTGHHIGLDHHILMEIRKELNDRFAFIKTRLDKIIFDPSMDNYLDKIHAAPFEEILYKRMALGYNVMNADALEETFRVRLDDRLVRMMDYGVYSRYEIRNSTAQAQIRVALAGVDFVSEKKLRAHLYNMSVTADDVNKHLRAFKSNGWIRHEGDQVTVLRKDLMVDPLEKYFTKV